MLPTLNIIIAWCPTSLHHPRQSYRSHTHRTSHARTPRPARTDTHTHTPVSTGSTCRCQPNFLSRAGKTMGSGGQTAKWQTKCQRVLSLAVAGSNGGGASKWLVQWGDAHTGTQGNLGRDRRVHSKRERRGNGRHSPQTNPSRTARLILISNLGPPPENRSTVEIPTSTLQNTKSESDRNRIGFGSESDRNRIGIGSESARKRNRIGIGSESDRNRIEIGSELYPLFFGGSESDRNRIEIGSRFLGWSE